MDSENKNLPALPNALFLAASGVGVLVAKGLLLEPRVPRLLIAATAVIWGFYLLGKNRYNQAPGWTSIAAGAALALFGRLLSAVSGVAGVGLIIAGLVSAITGFLRGSGNRE